MVRLVLLTILFLLSLLAILRAPTNLLWYVSILITEFSWIFFLVVCILLLWKPGDERYTITASLIGIASLILLAIPTFQAYRISQKLISNFDSSFTNKKAKENTVPFNALRMIAGIGAKKVVYKTLTYDSMNHLSLDFYPATTAGTKPCVIVIHGGSWAGGDSRQLPELNSELAKDGYHVASINYRLAPQNKYPSPIEDVHSALTFLRTQSNQFSIDTNNFILLGRSAGGQIALSAAYILNDPDIKGVISFYGPTDMVWGYENPTNPLVLNSRKIMEDYLGGTLNQEYQQYTKSSATETITKYSPPTLLIYGKNDPLVSYEHGTRLSAKLKAFGIEHFELYLPWGTHGFDYSLNGPGGQLSTWTVKHFLKAVIH
ncbi:MAG: alpha/beta hydrolase [Bacteroidota bacterium]|nr:alpha/beta hydrolase [Bacteroidota bacterium]